MESVAAVASLSALAQASRLAIFRHLVETGPRGAVAGAIATALDLAPATLSFHLKELTRAGLIANAQEGRFIRYSANFAAMNALVAYLTENCCGGAPCGAACTPVKLRRKPAATKSAASRARTTRARGGKQ